MNIVDLGLEIPPADQWNHVRQGDLLLVTPAKGRAPIASEWDPRYDFFRSMLLRESTGEILSVGFPKFWNYGEHQEHTEIMERWMASGDALFTPKLDGSLIIRAVIDGEVHLRTRGTIDGGEHAQAVRELVADRHPAFLDPGIGEHMSMLFEFTSPAYRIVLDYGEPGLTLLGQVRHEDLSVESPREEDALWLGTAWVEPQAVGSNFVERIRALQDDREGVVIQSPDGQHRLKVKTERYLKRHRLRFLMTKNAVREICEEQQIDSAAAWESWVLRESGGDYEVVEATKDLAAAYVRAIEFTEMRIIELQAAVHRAKRTYKDRKAFATEFALKRSAPYPGVLFNLLDGKVEQARELLREATVEGYMAEADAT